MRGAYFLGADKEKKFEVRDMEFKELATSGVPLGEKLYQEATKVRDWCRDDNSFDKFPEIKCRCGHRCVFEE